jgi:hypothetical protein
VASVLPATPGPSVPLGELGPADPATFSTAVDNTWFPLPPGGRWTYKGVKDAKRAVDVFSVDGDTVVIDSVTCVSVTDDLSLNGVPIERTVSYFAQHDDGSVWFFGEDVHRLDRAGRVTGLDGSWRAGVDGAVPGLMMPADPAKGDTWKQVTAHAGFEVLTTTKAVDVPYGSYPDAVAIEESDPGEPGIKFRKYYVASVGPVWDVNVGGPLEEVKLTDFRQP